MKKYLAFSLFVILLAGILIIARIKTHRSSIEVMIDVNNEKQEISGFGAADAWGCQIVGQNWPLEKRERIADWLFSNDTLENGQPRGAGLSIWRFNIGGGTAEQGDSSYIADEWRRAECFLGADGTYNWNKQQGQQWFLQAAKKRGVNNFVAFSNTPPVHFTKNGKGWSSGGNSLNLAPEKYIDYAGFLTEVLTYFDTQNIHIGTLSPFNEPQWKWDGKNQEGTPCQNTELFQAVNEISKCISRAGLNTMIELPEAGQIDYLFMDSTNLPCCDNQIFDFFDPSSPLCLNALPNISRSIAGHSYFSTFNTEHMKKMREGLHNEIQTINKKLAYNMTEYCVLEDNIEIKGAGRDTGIQSALYVAKVIHYDLTLAHAASWQWWLSVSPYDYKDGLVYTDLNKTDGNIYDSKMLWALGQYSFFVRPGMVRIESTTSNNIKCSDGEEGLLTSAFKSKDNKKIVSIVVNLSGKNQKILLNPGSDKYKKVRLYKTTSSTEENIMPAGSYKISDPIEIPAQSIVTLVITP